MSGAPGRLVVPMTWRSDAPRRESTMISTSSNAIAPTPSHCARPHRLVCAGATDKGMQRAHNEDRCGIFGDVGLFVVADGMGGAAAGEVAAQMAVEQVCRAVADPDVTWPTGMPAPPRAGMPCLIAGIERANRCIHAASLQRRDRQGMGTTIAALLAYGDRAVIAHVGDSRVYRLRGRVFDQLTEDHSLVNELIRSGVLNPDHAESFAHRNIITRSVGTAPTVEVDARPVDVALGDTFLLCSDGLCGVLSRDEMAQILIAQADLDEAVKHLIWKANQLGGPDNITAVAVRFEAADAPARARA